MRDPDHRRDQQEKRGAQPKAPTVRQPHPQGERRQRDGHAQAIVHEAIMKGIIVGERQREQRRSRQAPVRYAGDQQEAERGEHGDE